MALLMAKKRLCRSWAPQGAAHAAGSGGDRTGDHHRDQLYLYQAGDRVPDCPYGDTLPQALKPTEVIGNYMKVALLCGVILAMPFIVYQIARSSPG